MPTERKARDLSEFFKFTAFGQIVVGQVDKFFGPSGQYNTMSVVLVPALIRTNKGAQPKKYGSIALGLSGDLMAKLDMKADVHRYLSIEYVRKEPSKKGNDTKIFDVQELSEEEFSRMEAKASKEFESAAYKAPRVSDGIASEDDDLPF
jgi:hypothetical protein